MYPNFRYFLVIASMIFGATTLLAQNIALPQASSILTGPLTEITFEKTSFDFGTITEGEQVTRIYTFTNAGPHALVISQVKGSCGCTVPKWPKHPVAPGETASITAQFHSKGKPGRQVKRIVITANTDPSQTFVTISGMVMKATGDSPPTAHIIPDSQNHPAECVTIYPNPASETVRFKIPQHLTGTTLVISIFTNDGDKMAQRKLIDVAAEISFPVGHYPAGNYIAHITTAGNKPEVHCFVVTH